MTSLSGVGPKQKRALSKLGIDTVEDLLHHFPRDYIDRSLITPISQLPIGKEATFTAEVDRVVTRRPRKNLSILEVDVADDTGRIRLTWFNQQFRERHFTRGQKFTFSGRVEIFRGRLQMNSPSYEVLGGGPGVCLEVGRVVPVYPASADVSAAVIRRLCWEALERAGDFADPLTQDELADLGLITRTMAINQIHFPNQLSEVEAARKRLVVDELLPIQLALTSRRRDYENSSKGIAHKAMTGLAQSFVNSLPYELTGAQQRVIREIETAMMAPVPMHRMLQGEVGSGKTVVAAAALCISVAGGYQGALMAPTEVLAEQHYLGLTPLLSEVGVRVGLLTSNSRQRPQVIDAVASGEIDVVVGTHALLQEGVNFASLGLVIIDEQHRFGVHQRIQLRGQGAGGAIPDILIMTATPIPRTLAITVYGDLDVSTLDQVPPDRKPVKTAWLKPDQREVAYQHIRDEVAAGRRAFVVCPLIEESQKLQAVAAVEEHERLTNGPLKGLDVGLLHGRMRQSEKEAIMADFRIGAISVLVSTTVIEVGVDVPEATIMLIESAERFGLSQLHQLRGRVGRGAHGGFCYLVSGAQAADSVARLKAICSTSDGFELAERDLELRGEGSLFGVRQSGRTDLKLTHLVEDLPLIVEVRRRARKILESDPDLKSRPLLAEETERVLAGDVGWLELG